ncbi:ATP/ADP translocase [Bradyrhizobium sp. F1.13.4]
MRWLFVGVIGMSVGLGTLLITVLTLDNLMRGYGIFWWAMLTLLTMFAILVTGFTVMMRIK